jgi:uncharacterized membrane protein/membrane-bound inhibitor of C-type lysozyme
VRRPSAIVAAAVMALAAACSRRADQPGLAGSTHVYRCDDGYRFVARFEPERVWLFLGGQTMSLPQIPSPSGVHYTNGEVTFRSQSAGRGSESREPSNDEASIASAGSVHARCINQPAAVPWEEARLNGVDFRAVGRDPGWTLEVDAGAGIRFVTDGQAPQAFPSGGSGALEASAIQSTSGDGRTIRIERDMRECVDPLSGERFDITVRVAVNGRNYRGCGRTLR